MLNAHRAPDAAWAASLHIGKAFELRVAAMLEASPNVSRVNYDPTSTRKGYDVSFWFNGQPATAECKCDRMAAQTGNFFIQTRKDGRNHGLITTTATYWLVSLDDPENGPILVLRPNALLAYLFSLEKQGVIRKVEKAGRSGNTTGYLMPVQLLLACPGATKWTQTKEKSHAH